MSPPAPDPLPDPYQLLTGISDAKSVRVFLQNETPAVLAYV